MSSKKAVPIAVDTGGLPRADPLSGNEYFHLVQGGNSRAAEISDILALVPAGVVGLLPANNLSDVVSAITARANLGLGSAATFASGAFLQTANNLSDLGNVATARTNLSVYSKAEVNALLAPLGAGGLERGPITPFMANFALDNAGTATAVDSTHGIRLSAPAFGGDNVRALRYTGAVANFAAFTITMRSRRITWDGNNRMGGIFLRNSGSGKMICFWDWDVGAELRADRFSAYNVFVSNIVDTTYYASDFYWRRIVVAAGTISFEISPDGDNWFVYATEALATYIISIDQIGMCVNPNASNVPADTIFQSWEVS